MPGKDRLTRLLKLLVPPLCPGCGRAVNHSGPVCPACIRELNRAPVIRGDPPAGVSAIASCAGHEGVARRLLAAYKFRGLTSLQELISGYMTDLGSPESPGQVVIPIPAGAMRSRLRGRDPVEPLAADIVRGLAGATLRTDLLVRVGSGRQRGRGRVSRIGDPPDIRLTPAGSAGCRGRVLLVDDVITTGATLGAAATVLRDAGAGPVEAITFTRRR